MPGVQKYKKKTERKKKIFFQKKISQDLNLQILAGSLSRIKIKWL